MQTLEVLKTRQVRDARGAEWTIREVDSTAHPGSRGPRCLLCEDVGVVRRLWNYPSDWYELSDEELVALCGDRAAR